MKRTASIWLSVFALLLTCTAMRADDEQMLVVSFIDGSEIQLALSDTPRLAFPDDKVTVTAKQFSAEYPLYRVLDIRFVGATDVEGITPATQDDKSRLRIDYRTADEVVIYGDLSGHTVSLFTVGGSRLKTCSATTGGEVHISTAGLTPGTYIVGINGHSSFKIQVR